jgi:hypothetical protein
MPAEALAAAPIVIGLIQGVKFVYDKVRAQRPEARLLKWEKQITAAMMAVEEHKDYVLEESMESFALKCHMYHQLYFLTSRSLLI